MNKKLTLALYFIILVLVILTVSGIYSLSRYYSIGEDNWATVPLNEPYTTAPNQVTRIIDGDTFELASGETIRLLCIDTPEKGEQGYEEATLFLENLLLNEEPTLEPDIQDKDKYNRSLRYVYLNETFINKEIEYRLPFIGNPGKSQTALLIF